MTLADFTSPALVFPHLEGAAAGSVLSKLSRELHSQKRVPDWLRLYNGVLRDPSLASVNVDAEIAFPHARLAEVKIVSFAFGRCDKAIPWGADGSKHVRMIFLISAPEDDPSHYLALLSGLIWMTKNPNLVDALRGAADVARVVEIFDSVTVPSLRETRPSGGKGVSSRSAICAMTQERGRKFLEAKHEDSPLPTV